MPMKRKPPVKAGRRRPTTIRLDSDLSDRVERFNGATGVPFQQLAVRAIDEYLAKRGYAKRG